MKKHILIALISMIAMASSGCFGLKAGESVGGIGILATGITSLVSSKKERVLNKLDYDISKKKKEVELLKLEIEYTKLSASEDR
jgi:hypothetical protein